MVAEMVPEKELQPVAFSLMPLVWSLGSIFGPAFGGFFAKPEQQFPWLFGGVAFWEKFPYFLPNLVAAVVFLASITVAALFLRVRPSFPHLPTHPAVPPPRPTVETHRLTVSLGNTRAQEA